MRLASGSGLAGKMNRLCVTFEYCLVMRSKLEWLNELLPHLLQKQRTDLFETPDEKVHL